MTGDFWDQTMNDLILIIDGYYERQNKQSQHTRFISYMIYRSVADQKSLVEMYDFMPLPNDPTPEEREKMRQEDMKREEKRIREIFKNMREKGYDIKWPQTN